jgi:hypothetical protein
MALAGGASALTSLNNFLDLGNAGLSTTGQCKPFDAASDGYCRSKGAGLVVLKKLSTAVKAGDQMFGVIPSIATNQGRNSSSLTVLSPSALKTLYQGSSRRLVSHLLRSHMLKTMVRVHKPVILSKWKAFDQYLEVRLDQFHCPSAPSKAILDIVNPLRGWRGF